MPMKEWKEPVFCHTAGTSHVSSGRPCQDYVSVCHNEEYTIAALADGVGALNYSEIAAKEAVKGTVNWFMNNVEQLDAVRSAEEGYQGIREKLFPYLRKRIMDAAAEQNINVKQMDCNLAFVYIRKKRYGDDLAYFGRLGDCAVCVIGSDNNIYNFCDAAMVGPATDSVMHADAGMKLQLGCHLVNKDGIGGFILTSDGLAGAIYEKGSRYVSHAAQEYYNAVFEKNPGERIQALFAQIQKQSFFSDDLSIAVLSREDSPRTFPPDPHWLCVCGTKNPMSTSVCLSCERDYAEVYAGIKKKMEEDGFKDTIAYFRYLNQNPNKERLVIGLAPMIDTGKTANTPDKKNKPKQQDPAKQKQKQNPPQTPRQDPPAQPKEANEMNNAKKPGQEPKRAQNWEQQNTNDQYVVDEGPQTGPGARQDGSRSAAGDIGRTLISAVACILILSCLIINMVNGFRDNSDNRKTHEKLDEISDVILDLEVGQMAPSGNTQAEEQYRVELEDGSVYFGPVRYGVPHGYGVLQHDDLIMSGEFVSGRKEGLFVIRSASAPEAVSVVEYRNDAAVGEPGGIQQNQNTAPAKAGFAVSQDVKIYDSYANADEEMTEFPAGTVVQLTGTYHYSGSRQGHEAQLWLQITCLDDGTTGWCKADELGMKGQ